MRHRLRITALLVVAGLVTAAVAGCGGGSNNSSPPTTSTQQATTTGSSGTGFASAKNCLAFAGIAAKIASSMSPTSGNPGSDAQAATHEFQAFADAAPPAVKGDFQTFATAFSSYVTALQNSGYKLGSTTPPTSSQLAALVQAAKVFNTAKVKTAEHHLSAWAAQNCK